MRVITVVVTAKLIYVMGYIDNILFSNEAKTFNSGTDRSPPLFKGG